MAEIQELNIKPHNLKKNVEKWVSHAYKSIIMELS